MMDWIINNISTILVSALILGLVSLVIRKMVTDKRKGITSCGTSCSGCAMAGNCKEFKKQRN